MPPELPIPPALAAQLRHQLQLANRRMMWWIGWIFVAGLAVSILGLAPAVAAASERGSPSPGLFVFACFTLMFGWAVALWLAGPPVRPRIVPYFVREVAGLGPGTPAAFRRGRRLYLDIDMLDRLAESLGVRPLSSFGFADDHFDQQVRWHPAGDGLLTIEALARGLESAPDVAPGLAEDLEALAAGVREAARRGVEFSLVLRLYARDGLQAVSMEARQGSFW